MTPKNEDAHKSENDPKNKNDPKNEDGLKYYHNIALPRS